MEKNIEYCKCGEPIMEKIGGREFEFIKYGKGKPNKIGFEFVGNEYKYSCGNCGKKTTVKSNEITLGMAYAVTPLPKT